MAKERLRERFSFWLDVESPEQVRFSEEIKDLKKSRQFTTTVRDGIRLICELRQGKTDLLFKMFPAIKANLIESEARRTKDALDRLEQLIIQKGGSPMERSLPQVPTPMPARSLSAPRIDDDLDALVLEKSPSKKAAKNFLTNIINQSAVVN